MNELKLFIPITKIDAANRLVYGIATAEKADATKEICDYESTKPLYQKWSENFAKVTDGKSFGNLRSMHGKVAAGKLTQIAFNDDAKQIEVCGKVVDDAEWKKVEEGVYTGFSQGGSYIKRWKDPANPELMRYTAEPSEVSLVDNPCLPEATFQVLKADGSTEMRKFQTVEPAPVVVIAQPSNADVAAKATELAKAAGDETKWIDHLDAARAELAKARVVVLKAPAETLQAALVPTTAIAKVAGDTPRAAADGEYEQVWVTKRLPGKTFATKAAMRQAIVDLDAEEAASKTAAPVLDALKGITDQLDKKDGKGAGTEPAKPELAKKDYSDDDRAKMAKEGAAMKDGSFPIANKEDLESALKAHGHAKNKAAAKRHIIKRAKALGAAELLPDDWRATKLAGDDLKKSASLYGVSNLLQLLAALESAEEGCEYQDMWLGAVNVPKELSNRFGTAVVEIGDIAAELLDTVLGAMREEEAGEALARCKPIVTLMKAGARHSKGDRDLIQGIHDHASQLGAGCPDAEKAAPVTDLQKIVAERDELKNQMTAREGAFEKTLGGIATVLKDISVRVKNIEDQPVPSGPQRYRVAEKSDDRNGIAGSAEMMDRPGVLEGLAEIAIRKALNRPIRAIPGITHIKA